MNLIDLNTEVARYTWPEYRGGPKTEDTWPKYRGGLRQGWPEYRGGLNTGVWPERGVA